MNTAEHLSENRVKLTIEVSKETWQKALDKAFEIKVKDVKVDGFRPGKLPKSQYINRFGYQSLYEEALDIVFQETYPKAVVENKLRVVSNPDIDFDFNALSPEQGFTYTAEVDLFPVVHLGAIEDLKVKPLSKEVTEEELDNEIKNLISSKGENVIKNGPAEKGDITVIDFEGFLEGVPFEGGKGENYELELGSNTFIPGFEDQLLGIVAGEEREINVTFPENYHQELAGKNAMFKVVAHEVKNKVYPEWNDEEVQELEIENVSTVAEHREHLRNELTQKRAEEYENHLTNAVVEAYTDLATVDIPKSMIQNYVNQMKRNIEDQANQYKIPLEVFLQFNGLTIDNYESEFAKFAEKRIKQDLVMDQLISQEKFEATEEELDKFYQTTAEENHSDVETIKKQIDAEDARYRVQFNKALDFLKEKAVLV
ncbi:MAG: trigger factor [Bacilli bacterium]|nr:trigger factor [Bacilli bacterium]HHU24364.1 trigger factor [Acholeplasmataceae bacterium]